MRIYNRHKTNSFTQIWSKSFKLFIYRKFSSNYELFFKRFKILSSAFYYGIQKYTFVVKSTENIVFGLKARVKSLQKLYSLQDFIWKRVNDTLQGRVVRIPNLKGTQGLFFYKISTKYLQLIFTKSFNLNCFVLQK